MGGALPKAICHLNPGGLTETAASREIAFIRNRMFFIHMIKIAQPLGVNLSELRTARRQVEHKVFTLKAANSLFDKKRIAFAAANGHAPGIETTFSRTTRTNESDFG